MLRTIIILLISIQFSNAQDNLIPVELFQIKIDNSVKIDTNSWEHLNNMLTTIDFSDHFIKDKQNYQFIIESQNSLIYYYTHCNNGTCLTIRLNNIKPENIDTIQFKLTDLPDKLVKSLLTATEFPLVDKLEYVIHDGSSYLFQGFDSNGYRHFWTDNLNSDQNNILIFHYYIFNDLTQRTIKHLRKNGR